MSLAFCLQFVTWNSTLRKSCFPVVAINTITTSNLRKKGFLLAYMLPFIIKGSTGKGLRQKLGEWYSTQWAGSFISAINQEYASDMGLQANPMEAIL